jgi:hypothetical protein
MEFNQLNPATAIRPNFAYSKSVEGNRWLRSSLSPCRSVWRLWG